MQQRSGNSEQPPRRDAFFDQGMFGGGFFGRDPFSAFDNDPFFRGGSFGMGGDMFGGMMRHMQAQMAQMDRQMDAMMQHAFNDPPAGPALPYQQDSHPAQRGYSRPEQRRDGTVVEEPLSDDEDVPGAVQPRSNALHHHHHHHHHRRHQHQHQQNQPDGFAGSGGSFYSSSRTVTVGPNGVSHATRVTRDSRSGIQREERVQRLGDQERRVVTERSGDGTVRSTEHLRNVEDSKIDEFDSRWQSAVQDARLTPWITGGDSGAASGNRRLSDGRDHRLDYPGHRPTGSRDHAGQLPRSDWL